MAGGYFFAVNPSTVGAVQIHDKNITFIQMDFGMKTGYALVPQHHGVALISSDGHPGSVQRDGFAFLFLKSQLQHINFSFL
jgi:hypothetical protein